MSVCATIPELLEKPTVLTDLIKPFDLLVFIHNYTLLSVALNVK